MEIFDTQNDYEPIRSIATFHTAAISCMAEHHKFLLSGSYDQTIGVWDI